MQPAARRARSNKQARRPRNMASQFASAITQPLRRGGAILILSVTVLVSSLSAQQQGPLPAPATSATAQPAAPAAPAASLPSQGTVSVAPATKTQSDSGNISHEPPSLPVEQIIQKFGER